MSHDQPVKTILILAANPKGTVPLRLDEEVREIKAGLQRSRHRDRFVVEYESAARPGDVQQAMLDYEPQVVHFCGHGEGSKGLVLEDENGQPKLVSTEALADLFGLFADKVECVLLNACYSEVQAKAIAQHIDSVIGMTQPIGDKAAIKFAVSFYKALGAGKAVQFAFNLGRNAMQLEGIAEERTPVLILQSAQVEAAKSNPTAIGEIADSRKATLVPEPEPQSSAEASSNQSSQGSRSRIFISYKRGVEPDEPLARAIYQALSVEHEVFIDQTMTVGTRWAERIEAEIRQSDFLITLLSAHSVQSEMVVGEVETAHQVAQTGGKPKILPIRVAYREPFVYPLSAYLNGINWAFWDSEADTPRLVQELQQAIAGEPLSIATEQSKAELTIDSPVEAMPKPLPAAQPMALEPPEGTMDAESQFYVARTADETALQAIGRQGVTITIKAARQMGKSSLLIRIMDAAMQAGKQVVFLDFQLLNATALGDADLFFRQFCDWLTDQLGLPNRVEDYWTPGLGNNQRCTRYLQLYLLKELGRPLLIAMDEVDRIFDTEFQSDFFSMLRGWHNNRALPMTKIWKQCDLALVTATEPYHLIANLNQSPFNVGEVLTLSDFTLPQVTELNQKHGAPFNSQQLQVLMGWLSGHPYLVRKALYLVASGQFSVAELFTRATDDRGPFGDHLRYHLFRINDRQDLIEGLKQVIQHQTCADQRVLRLLSAAGLVYREEQIVLPRCRLYAEYFGERLHG
jgi:hypothetical protein